MGGGKQMGNEISILNAVAGWEFDRNLRASNYLNRTPDEIKAFLPDGVIEVFKKMTVSSTNTMTQHYSPMMYHPQVLAWAILLREHVALATEVFSGNISLACAEDRWTAVRKGGLAASAPLGRAKFTCTLDGAKAVVSAKFKGITLTSAHTAGSNEISLSVVSDRVVPVDGSFNNMVKNLMEITVGKLKRTIDGGNERRSLRTPFMWAETGIPMRCVIPRFPSYYYVPSKDDFDRPQSGHIIRYSSNPDWAHNSTRVDAIKYVKDARLQKKASELAEQFQSIFDTMVTMGAARYEPTPGLWRNFTVDVRARINKLVDPIIPYGSNTMVEEITEEVNEIITWATTNAARGVLHDIFVPKAADTHKYVSRRMGVWRPA
jgi:hypothetical protein